MADLITAYANDNTLTNVGVNFNQVKNANGLGPRTLIVTLKNTADGTAVVSNAAALAFVRAVANAGGVPPNDQNGPDAFTIAGVSGVGAANGLVFVLQGTGTLNVTVADHTVATIATFDQA
jgi:hypothetical protein